MATHAEELEQRAHMNALRAASDELRTEVERLKAHQASLDEFDRALIDRFDALATEHAALRDRVAHTRAGDTEPAPSTMARLLVAIGLPQGGQPTRGLRNDLTAVAVAVHRSPAALDAVARLLATARECERHALITQAGTGSVG